MIDVEIEDGSWTEALPEAARLAETAAQAALSTPPPQGEVVPEGPEGLSSPESADLNPLTRFAGAPLGEQLGISILFTDDEAVRELNARFRGKDKPTNVLSFPAGPNPEGHLGDIALGFGVCAREAAEQGKPLAHHLQHLVAHGVLHLLGYDHMSDDEAETMEGLERVVLAGLGVPDPYQAGERDHD